MPQSLRTRLLEAVQVAADDFGRSRHLYARPDDWGAFVLTVRGVAKSFDIARHPRLTQLLWAEWMDCADRAERMCREDDRTGDDIDAAYEWAEYVRDVEAA